MGRSGKTRTGLIAALDVGSSKICCLIAQAHNDGAIRISGVGHHASLGIKSGAIVDMAAAQNSILTAVSAAEEMAGERIREVILSVAGSNLSSQNYSATCFVSGKEISENEIRRLLGRAGEIEQPLIESYFIAFLWDTAWMAPRELKIPEVCLLRNLLPTCTW